MRSHATHHLFRAPFIPAIMHSVFFRASWIPGIIDSFLLLASFLPCTVDFLHDLVNGVLSECAHTSWALSQGSIYEMLQHIKDAQCNTLQHSRKTSFIPCTIPSLLWALTQIIIYSLHPHTRHHVLQ